MSMNPVAVRIQALLDQRGEKLKPVTVEANVSYYSVYPWWQREHAKADYEKVKALANYFEVPVAHLMYGDPIEEKPDTVDHLHERIQSLKDSDRKELENYLDFLTSKNR